MPNTDALSVELVQCAQTMRNEGKQPAEIIAHLLEVYAEEPPRHCRVCGCTDEHACEAGCWWVADDLCSTCRDEDLAEITRLLLSEVRAQSGHFGDEVERLLGDRIHDRRMRGECMTCALIAVVVSRLDPPPAGLADRAVAAVNEVTC